MKLRALYVLCIIGVGATGLAACDNAESLENDWIDTPTEPKPKPSPTPTPSYSPTSSDYYDGPADVERYVNRFVDDARIQNVDVTTELANPKLQIQIADLSGYGEYVIGLCETSYNLKRVTFQTEFWNSSSESMRELLAHHELGHCVLYRNHRSDVLVSGAYASIMYPVIMSANTYNANYDYYQTELFTWGSSLLSAFSAESRVHICDLDELL